MSMRATLLTCTQFDTDHALVNIAKNPINKNTTSFGMCTFIWDSIIYRWEAVAYDYMVTIRMFDHETL